MKPRFVGRSLAQRVQNLALRKRFTIKTQAIAQRIQNWPLRQRLTRKIVAIALVMKQWLTQEVTWAKTRQIITYPVQVFWSFLQFGRIFRRMGLPAWTFAGVGISAIWFNYIGVLLEQALKTLFGTSGAPTRLIDFAPPLIVFLVPFALVIAIGLLQSARSQLIRQRSHSGRLRQPEGKKGLILLVSNPDSALHAISYHFEQKGTLERVWLLPSDSSDVEEFGDSSFPKAELIQQKCAELSMALGKPLTVEIHKHGVSPSDSQDTFDAVNRIFRQSGYLSHELIADFTGGTKPMTVGMIMACLPAERELEYVSSTRKGDAKPQSHGPFIIDYQHSAFDLVG